MNAGRFELAALRSALGRPLVMGILNVTPDSFFDGGRWLDQDQALRHAIHLAEAGADIIDIGGESTRPGSEPIDASAEILRVVPLIERLRSHLDIPVSIDTCKPLVMREAVAAGASMVNDVTALRAAGAVSMVASLGVPVCLMHMQGEPRDMQLEPNYQDVVMEVKAFLLERAGVCQRAGIRAADIVLDPGFGFGKNLQHNRALFKAIPELCALGYPVLVGVSRKSMLGLITGQPAPGRMPASVVAAVLAAQRGAAMVRVHDVAETVAALATLASL